MVAYRQVGKTSSFPVVRLYKRICLPTHLQRTSARKFDLVGLTTLAVLAALGNSAIYI